MITKECVVMLRRTALVVLVVVVIVHFVAEAVVVISVGIESMGIRFVGIVVKCM